MNPDPRSRERHLSVKSCGGLFPPGDYVVVLAGFKAEPFGWLRQP